MSKLNNLNYYIVIKEEGNKNVFDFILSNNIGFAFKYNDTIVNELKIKSDIVLSFTQQQVENSDYLSSIFNHCMGNVFFISIPGISSIFSYNDFDEWIYDNDNKIFRTKPLIKNSFTTLYKIQLYIVQSIKQGKFTLVKDNDKVCIVYNNIFLHTDLLYMLDDNIYNELLHEYKIEHSEKRYIKVKPFSNFIKEMILYNK